MIFENKNILAIGAHPDDIEIGCGGTLLKAAEAEADIHLLTLTRGEKGNDPVKRVQEADTSMSVLTNSIWLGQFEDRNINYMKAVERIRYLIDEWDIDYIFTHAPDDIHQDHRVVSKATLSACQQNILYYRSYAARNFQPNLYVDITDTLEEKLELLDIYKSQSHLNLREVCRARAVEDAILMPFDYGEGFQCDRLIV